MGLAPNSLAQTVRAFIASLSMISPSFPFSFTSLPSSSSDNGKLRKCACGWTLSIKGLSLLIHKRIL